MKGPPLTLRQISNDCSLEDRAFHASEIFAAPGVAVRFDGAAGTSPEVPPPAESTATSSIAETVAQFTTLVNDTSILPSVTVTGNDLVIAVLVPALAAMS